MSESSATKRSRNPPKHSLLNPVLPKNSATPASPSKRKPASAFDPLFAKDPVLNSIEMELLWLGVESMYCDPDPDCRCFKWGFIWDNSTENLRMQLRQLSDAPLSEDMKTDESIRLQKIVRMDDDLVRDRFQFLRYEVMLRLRRGYRRKAIALTIAQAAVGNRQKGRQIYRSPSP